MPATPQEPPHPLPPKGVPRWLWPPPDATVERAVLAEHVDSQGGATYTVTEGAAPVASHLRALEWLLDEHSYGRLPDPGIPFEGMVLLEIARSELKGDRVGHAYALNGGPLGAPSGDAPRGILRRYIADRLGRRILGD